MLKIREEVDLKELEKFGFTYHNDIQSSYFGCCEYYSKEIGVFVNNAKTISITNNTAHRSLFELDILYDLIQARIGREGVRAWK